MAQIFGTITITEFARRMGVDESTVREAVKSGKITEQAVDRTNPRRPRIIEEIAVKDWAQNYAPRHIQNDELNDRLLGKIMPLPELPEGMEDFDDGPVEEVDDMIKVRKTASLAEAKRVEAIYKAKTAALEYAEKKKTLVSRAKLDKELFALGQEVSSAMLGIPDKWIDNILATDSRMEAHSMLYSAITEALEAMSKNIEV